MLLRLTWQSFYLKDRLIARRSLNLASFFKLSTWTMHHACYKILSLCLAETSPSVESMCLPWWSMNLWRRNQTTWIRTCWPTKFHLPADRHTTSTSIWLLVHNNAEVEKVQLHTLYDRFSKKSFVPNKGPISCRTAKRTLFSWFLKNWSLILKR